MCDSRKTYKINRIETIAVNRKRAATLELVSWEEFREKIFESVPFVIRQGGNVGTLSIVPLHIEECMKGTGVGNICGRLLDPLFTG
jgi:hypothetical protein